MSGRLFLPHVTLCAAASVNVKSTILALTRCLKQASFGRTLFFTDAAVDDLPAEVEAVRIEPLRSACEYSQFMLHDLVSWIDTSHCLVAQWDGFIVNADAWDPAFLECDYIGAPWPQFDDGHDVGNGGFSLRSRRLMEACLDRQFVNSGEAEDVTIARRNRLWLEQARGMRFADNALASRFSFERSGQGNRTFGFHGAFNLPSMIGTDGFWEIYLMLDEMQAIRTNFWPLLGMVAKDRHGFVRTAKMAWEHIWTSAR